MPVDGALELNVPGTKLCDGLILYPREEVSESDDILIEDPVDSLRLLHQIGRDAVPVLRRSVEELSEIHAEVTESFELV